MDQRAHQFCNGEHVAESLPRCEGSVRMCSSEGLIEPSPTPASAKTTTPCSDLYHVQYLALVTLRYDETVLRYNSSFFSNILLGNYKIFLKHAVLLETPKL